LPILEPRAPDSPGGPDSPGESGAPAVDAAALRNAAYRHLARREHSAWELRRKLQTAAALSAAGRGKRKRNPDNPGGNCSNYNWSAPAPVAKAPAPAELSETLDRLLAELAAAGAQSDQRFAEHLGRWRFQSGRGPAKLRHELAEHRIAPELIEQVMAEYQPQWRDAAARVRARKFGDAPPPDYKTWAKQARFLQQRGFTAEYIEPFGG